LKEDPAPANFLRDPFRTFQILDVVTEQTPGNAHGVFTVETVDD
jgi:hypothetical protein